MNTKNKLQILKNKLQILKNGVDFLDSFGIIIQVFLDEEIAKRKDKTDIWKKGSPMCLAAANRIINRTNAQNLWRYKKGQPRIALNGKRLQKLLYLCQLFWYIDHDESQMITEDFQAWPNGPVIPQVYDYFSVYQDGDMCPLRNVSTYILSQEESTLINKVVDSTIDIPTESIIDYTHIQGGPWDLVYKCGQGVYNTIPKDSIKQYISDQAHQDVLMDFIKDGRLHGSN